MTDRAFPHEHVSLLTDPPDAARLATLAALYPDAMTEGRVDLAKLADILQQQDAAVTGPAERYSFSWAGKRDAIRAAQTPSAATLIPEPAQSVDFATTQNLFIEGDNLEVLKLLHRAYFGRVKMIYIDPPYNTGNDFVYPDDYSDPLGEYLQLTGQRDAGGALLTTNPETSGRYHSAWLSMMYPRLALARSFLREDGVIFVSIDDHEVHNLRLLMNEIFGEENFVATFVWKRRTPSALAEKLVSVDHEYLVAYQKGGFSSFLGKPKDYANYSNPDNDPNGPWALDNLTVGMTKDQRPNQFYDLVDPRTGRVFPANPNRVWAFIPETMAKEIEVGGVVFPSSTDKRPMLKRYKNRLKSDVNPVSTWMRGAAEAESNNGVVEMQTGLNSEGTKAIQDIFGTTVFNYSKPTSLLTSLIKYTAQPDDIILDFFGGSCTTAQAVLELNREDGGNRRFIMAQLPEPTGNPAYPTIAEIGKERIRRVIARMRQADAGTLGLTTRDAPEDLGFRVFRLAPASARSWQPPSQREADAWLRQMELTGAPISPDATDRDLIWEAAIREGYSLTSRITQVNPGAEPPIWRVSDPDRNQHFTICLAPRITLEPLRALGLTRDDLFICRETALDDSTGANLALQCRLKTL